MNYNYYSQYIYEYLTQNDIAGKLDSIISGIDSVKDLLSELSKVVPILIIFLFLYVGFNTIKRRWLFL